MRGGFEAVLPYFLEIHIARKWETGTDHVMVEIPPLRKMVGGSHIICLIPNDFNSLENRNEIMLKYTKLFCPST